MNGTAEAILDELLKNSKAQTEILKKLAGSFKPTSGSGPGGTGQGLGGLASAATEATKQFNPMIKAISVLSNVLSGIVGVIGDVIGSIAGLGMNLFDLAKKAAEGKARLHDLFDAFSELPLGIGKLASIFSSMVKISEGLLDSYRTLTESGASFGGSLQAVHNIATAAGLTLDEFQKVIKDNSDTFATMGGSVADGIRKFADASSDLIGPRSRFREAIFGMGYTAQQANEMLITMTKGQGAMGRAGAATAEQLAKYTAEYMTQLDGLAKVTGIQRDQLDKAVKKAEEEQLWQSFKDSLGPEAAKRVTQALAAAQAMGGEALVNVVKNQFRGIDAPLDEAATNMAITTGGMSVQIGNLVRGIISGQTSITTLTNTFQQMDDASLRLFNSMGVTGVLSSGLFNQAQIQAARRTGDISKAEEKARKDQLKSAVSDAAALGNAEQSLKLLGMNIMNMFYKILAPFNSIILDISNSLLGIASEKITPMGEAINQVVNWLTKSITEISGAFKEGGLKGGFTKIWDKLAEAAKNIWEVIGPPIIKLWEDDLLPWLKTAFSNLFDLVIDTFLRKINPFMESSEKHQARLRAEELRSRAETNPEDEKAAAYKDFAENYIKAHTPHSTGRATGTPVVPDLPEVEKAFEKYYNRISGLEEIKVTAQKMTEPNRAGGSLGATGNLFENWGKETAVNLHGTESVVTPEQMGKIISGAGQNTLSEDLKQLNTLTQQLLNYMKQTADNTRLTHDATRALNGNLLEAF